MDHSQITDTVETNKSLNNTSIANTSIAEDNDETWGGDMNDSIGVISEPEIAPNTDQKITFACENSEDLSVEELKSLSSAADSAATAAPGKASVVRSTSVADIDEDLADLVLESDVKKSVTGSNEFNQETEIEISSGESDDIDALNML